MDLANVSSWFSLLWSTGQEGTSNWGAVSSRDPSPARTGLPSPPHHQSAGHCGHLGQRRWRRQQLHARALQLSPGFHLTFFVCFFNQMFLDFLAESSWVGVLRRSSGCYCHLKIPPKDNLFGWEGLNSMTKSTIPIGCTWPESNAAAEGPCRAQWIVSEVFLFSRHRLTEEGSSFSQRLQPSSEEVKLVGCWVGWAMQWAFTVGVK